MTSETRPLSLLLGWLIATYGHCLACGSSENLTIDHVVPRALGGMRIRSNAQLLCKTCNAAKGMKVLDYRRGVEKAAEHGREALHEHWRKGG